MRPLGADPESRDSGFALRAPRNDDLLSKHLAILHEAGDVGDLIVENPRLRLAGLGQPVHPAGARRLRLFIHGLDQRPSQTETVVMRSVTGTVRYIKAEHRQFEKFYLD